MPRQSRRYSVQVRSPHEHLNIWIRLPVSESIMARISCNCAPHRHVLVEALGSSATISALKTLKCCMASPGIKLFLFNYLYQNKLSFEMHERNHDCLEKTQVRKLMGIRGIIVLTCSTWAAAPCLARVEKIPPRTRRRGRFPEACGLSRRTSAGESRHATRPRGKLLCSENAESITKVLG